MLYSNCPLEFDGQLEYKIQPLSTELTYINYVPDDLTIICTYH